MPKIAVLGAGLAGLSCAYELSKKGFDVTVFEKNSQEGGLAKSISTKNFVSDIGPHRFHPKNKALVGYLQKELGIKFITRERKSMIYLNGKFINYPLEVLNIIQSIPLIDSFRMFFDYLIAKTNFFNVRNSFSFEDWVQGKFGKSIYEFFFKGYTEKVLGLNCKKISKDWSEQRIKLLDLKNIMKSFSGNNSNGPENLFYYPEKGGVGSFSRRFKEEILKRKGKVKFNCEIQKIKRKANKITGINYTQNGKILEETFDYFVSTIPIRKFTELINSPEPIINAGKKLNFRSIVFVYLLLNKEGVSNNNWIYFPDKKFLCNRVSEPKNFSPKNVSDKNSVICAEITCNFNDAVWNKSNEVITQETISSLAGTGLINSNNVIDFQIVKEPFVYPIFTLNYKEDLAKVFEYLDSFENLRCIGRSGAFSYQNMDASIEQGLETARIIR